MGVVGCIIFAAIGLLQIWTAFLGMVYYTGTFWPLVIMGFCFFARFTLPITIFTFLGAMKVWDWEWYWALLFTLPGLLFIVPSIMASIIDGTRNLYRR